MTPGLPLALDHARHGIFAALWARAEGAKLVSSNVNPTALDDLEWLGVEPDAMTSAPKLERYQAALEELVEAGKVYPCFCRESELRKMPEATDGCPSGVIYDGRCSRLSDDERKAMKRGGRSTPSMRLTGSASPITVSLAGRKNFKGMHAHDILVFDAEGMPTAAFATVVDDHNARVSHSLVTGISDADLLQQAVISHALGWTMPTAAVLPDLPVTELSDEKISTLRTNGFLPHVVLQAILDSGWKGAPTGDVDALGEAFNLKALLPKPTALEVGGLRTANQVALGTLTESELLNLMLEHLTRRGYPIVERESGWQERFIRALSQLETLGDAEPLAAALLGASPAFSPENTRVFKSPSAGELFDALEVFLGGLKSDKPADWHSHLQDFRQEVGSPGRALATLRVALTGARRGPPMAPVLALMGPDECRTRLETARRYAQV